MAKYNAHYSCGHSAEIQLFGKNTERQRKLEWYAKSGECPACYKAKQEAERAAAAAAAMQVAGKLGLPAIDDGSEKQIAWAERIRAEVLASTSADPKLQAGMAAREAAIVANKTQNHGLTREIVDARFGAVRDAAAAARAKLETETSARWWIDNRETAANLIEKGARAMTREVFPELDWEAK